LQYTLSHGWRANAEHEGRGDTVAFAIAAHKVDPWVLWAVRMSYWISGLLRCQTFQTMVRIQVHVSCDGSNSLDSCHGTSGPRQGTSRTPQPCSNAHAAPRDKSGSIAALLCRISDDCEEAFWRTQTRFCRSRDGERTPKPRAGGCQCDVFWRGALNRGLGSCKAKNANHARRQDRAQM
jgi:hypothetical protein